MAVSSSPYIPVPLLDLDACCSDDGVDNVGDEEFPTDDDDHGAGFSEEDDDDVSCNAVDREFSEEGAPANTSPDNPLPQTRDPSVQPASGTTPSTPTPPVKKKSARWLCCGWGTQS